MQWKLVDAFKAASLLLNGIMQCLLLRGHETEMARAPHNGYMIQQRGLHNEPHWSNKPRFGMMRIRKSANDVSGKDYFPKGNGTLMNSRYAYRDANIWSRMLIWYSRCTGPREAKKRNKSLRIEGEIRLVQQRTCKKRKIFPYGG